MYFIDSQLNNIYNLPFFHFFCPFDTKKLKKHLPIVDFFLTFAFEKVSPLSCGLLLRIDIT